MVDIMKKRTNEKEHKKGEKKLSLKEKIKGSFNIKYIKNGSYSMAVSAIFIVIVVVINLIINAVPSKYSEIDVSDQKLTLQFIRWQPAVLKMKQSKNFFRNTKKPQIILRQNRKILW